MLGTIEELEKEIELFQNNIMASGELVTLLRQMLDQVKRQNENFAEQSNALISRVDELPSVIDRANSESNLVIQEAVSHEMTQALQCFDDEQNKYLLSLGQTKQQIGEYMKQSDLLGKEFERKTQSIVEKLDSVMNQIQIDNEKANHDLLSAVDKMLEEKNEELGLEQQKYISAMQHTEQTIESAKEKLDTSFKEFNDTLEKTNISSLYEQNQQIKSDLNKRTTILMVITVISVILGIVGILI